ncbi:MAG: hypothetical protein WEF86_06330 [Gemmatimonadota bacterium]
MGSAAEARATRALHYSYGEVVVKENMMQGLTQAARGAAVAALIAVAAVVFVTPPRVNASDLSGCSDGTWSSYNSCLMKADGRFEQYLCDADFVLSAVRCVAEEIGTIRKAIEG